MPLAAEPPNALVGQGLDVARGIAPRLCEGDELEDRHDLLLQAAAAWTHRVLEEYLDVALGRLAHLGAGTHGGP
jgi:hypothetical protein